MTGTTRSKRKADAAVTVHDEKLVASGTPAASAVSASGAQDEMKTDDDDEDEIEYSRDGADGQGALHQSQSSRHAISCCHPRGVQPMGNLLFDGGRSIRTSGLGLLGAGFTDEALLDFLKSFLTAPDLLAAQQCSRALYIFANEEEIWRHHTLERWGGDFAFLQDWKNTFANMQRKENLRRKQQQVAASTAAASSASTTAAAAAPLLSTDKSLPDFPLLPTPLRFKGLYSDFLFQSFYCSHIDLLSSYGDAKKIATASAPLDTIPRIHVRDLTPERFRTEFGVPNRPLIIQGLMDDWPCFKSGPNQWTQENWLAKFGSQPFKVGRYVMTLQSYFRYMNQIASDESPLYLFDSRFGEKVPEMLEQYSVPEYFRSDLFNLIPDEEKAPNGERIRPAFRWILVGPERSGSTFHKDPNHTSAWNALISGRKKWIMYPMDTPPPGVFPSGDHAEVTTPISVAEWFINFYAEHRTKIEEFEERKAYEIKKKEQAEKQRIKREAAAATAAAEAAKAAGEEESKEAPAATRGGKKAKTHVAADAASTAASAASSVPLAAAAAASSSSPTADAPLLGPIECICEPGEVIFIPNGWWHTALNLSPSFAVTQNYVNEENIWNVCQLHTTHTHRTAHTNRATPVGPPASLCLACEHAIVLASCSPSLERRAHTCLAVCATLCSTCVVCPLRIAGDFLRTDPGERERNLTLLQALEEKLEAHRPDLAQMVQQKQIEKELAESERIEAERKASTKKKSSLWDSLTSGTATGFSFQSSS